MKKLGFGLMRLPQKEGQIDIEQTKQMVDCFMEAGFTYFDTAYVYPGSEVACRQALVERYPRQSYTLATKINAWMGHPDADTCKAQLKESLERTRAGYFDYYLLHALQRSNYKMYEDYKIWDFVKEAKEQGLIKHYGFSFHSSPDLLDKLLTEHPEVDFVQLQLNYADWENPSVMSRANYEMARKHGKDIVVMEPVKGGTLANVIPEVEEVFKKADPNASMASWAIRYVASLDGVRVVLSGMSNLEQMEDNISYMKDFQPLNASEQMTIKEVMDILNQVDSVPCTACHYCVPGCPQKIPIPDIFDALNRKRIFRSESADQRYRQKTEGKGKASMCIQCGQCEAACPQQIPIIQRLQEAAEIFE